MNTRFLIPLLVAGALAFACGPRSHSDPGKVAVAQTTTVTSKANEQPKRPKPITKEAKLDHRLKVDVHQNAVRFAFDVANVGGKHIELSFPSGKSYDFVVFDSTGREVWNSAKGRMFTQGVQNKQLSFGDSINVSEEWESLPQPGLYTAIATLHSTNYPITDRIEFVIR